MSAEFNDAMSKSPLEGWTYERLIDCTSDGNLSYGIVQPGMHDENGIPIVRVNNVNNGQLRLNDVLHVSAEIESKYKRTRLEGGEVLLTLVGSTGQSVVAPKELAGWNIARAIAVIRSKPEIGANWINICLQTREVQQFLNERANTTVQKTLNLGDVRELPIPIPPKDVKKKIEDIAMSLAHKIELNRQINQTLEQIAQTIFKSWFVDFEPVKAKIEAKAAGRDPERAAMCAISGKLEPELDQLLPEQRQQLAATASLFPDELMESELGMIPQGWGVGTIGDEFELTMGQSPPGNTYNESQEGLPFYQGRTDFGFRFPTQRIFCTAPTRFADVGDTLVSVRAPVGDINMATERCCIGRGVAAARHKSKSRSYAYYFMQSIEEVFGRFEAEGTVFGSISKKDFHNIQCVTPSEEVVRAFGRLVSSLDERIANGEQVAQTLATLRDTLLPKLLSGELQPPSIPPIL